MADSSGTLAPTPGPQGKVAFITGAARAASEGCLARMGQLTAVIPSCRCRKAPDPDAAP